MKAFFFSAILVTVAVGLTPDIELMERLETCMRAIEATDAAHRERVPQGLMRWAPGMKAFGQAVSHLRSGVVTTRERLEGANVNAAERHLAQNGALGCEKFLGAYQAKARAFFALVCALGCLILVLTARLGLAMVPAIQPKANLNINKI